jgi:hypothetical protein
VNTGSEKRVIPLELSFDLVLSYVVHGPMRLVRGS